MGVSWLPGQYSRYTALGVVVALGILGVISATAQVYDTTAAVPGGLPIDWLNGTGVCPAAGIVNVTSVNRRWFEVRNNDLGIVTETLSAAKQSDHSATTVKLFVNAAGISGTQGNQDQWGIQEFVPQGPITISCTAGLKLVVLEWQ